MLHYFRLCNAMRTRLIMLGLVVGAHVAAAQTRPGAEFQLTKITKNLITTPQFAYKPLPLRDSDE